ncbi:hypothetical protein ACPUYX_13880 [Desulfosporosinus sp. SYSU MS00001]|uniref:hypothetical protein n=1 Tax=Desulfosporosinus sp. SYSU MS00001 TaxID=3416284 RepID=UPI003CFA2FCB
MGKFVDITGHKFGRLTVRVRAPNDIHNKAMWQCECDCGEVVIVCGTSLRTGKTSSCGCLNREMTSAWNRSHQNNYGDGNTRLYRIWKSIRHRTGNSNSTRYAYYGGRGISVCDEWKDDFEAFKQWALSNDILKNCLSIELM